MMEFRLTEKYIRKRKNSGLVQTAVFTLMALVFAGVAFLNDPGVGITLLIAGGLIVAIWVVQGIKQHKLWSQTGPQIVISVHPDHILSRGPGRELRIQAQHIAKLKLQQRGSQLLSILLCYQNGKVEKLEGYEQMDQLARQLSHFVGQDKVKTARFLHQ